MGLGTVKRRKPPKRSKASRSRPSSGRRRAGRRGLRAVVERLVAEAIEDRLDYLESEASLEDGKPVPAVEVLHRLGM